MKNILQKMKMLIIACFTIAFVIHISMIVFYKLNPSYPEVKYYKKDLKEIDFPIVFQICIEEKKNNDTKMKYKDLGYQDLFDFFTGQSRFNKSIFGWAGHSENGSSIASVKGFTIRFN